MSGIRHYLFAVFNAVSEGKTSDFSNKISPFQILVILNW